MLRIGQYDIECKFCGQDWWDDENSEIQFLSGDFFACTKCLIKHVDEVVDDEDYRPLFIEQLQENIHSRKQLQGS